jgi:hypothetical protein
MTDDQPSGDVYIVYFAKPSRGRMSQIGSWHSMLHYVLSILDIDEKEVDMPDLGSLEQWIRFKKQIHHKVEEHLIAFSIGVIDDETHTLTHYLNWVRPQN